MEETTKATNIVTDTVQVLPKPKESIGTNNFVLQMAYNHDEIPEWGTQIKARDRALEKFWKTEPFMASAITSVAMTRSSLGWKLTGNPKTVDRIQKVLKRSDFGRGWQSLMSKVTISLLTQDQGAFLEIIRPKPQRGRKPESAPVIAINHLPTSQCTRTGNPLYPVIYTDKEGRNHKMAWYQVAALSDIPIPGHDNKNLQYCFVSRVLKSAKTMKSISNYYYEKVSGRFGRSIFIASGVSQSDIDDLQTKAELDMNNMGLRNFSSPLIISTLDPTANISVENIDLASVPDGFDFDSMMHNWILLLSVGLGVDYLELSPLQSSSLGSAEQTSSLIQKARVKSLLLFMKIIETALINAKVIPPNISFQFENSDGDVESHNAEVAYRRAQTRKTMIEMGEITPEIGRRMALDSGDLLPAYVAMLDNAKLETITVADSERVSERVPDENITVLTPSQEGEDVSIDVADEAAKWFTKLLKNNPINAVVPIPDYEIETFRVSLRNRIQKSCTIGTDEIWLDDKLVDSAKDAGIEAHALRYRLPDNYKIVITKDYIKDTNGSTIYIKEHKKDTTKTIYMILEDLTLDNYEEKLNEILELTNTTETKKYVTELHKLKYFDNVELLRLKLTATYYEKLAK